MPEDAHRLPSARDLLLGSLLAVDKLLDELTAASTGAGRHVDHLIDVVDFLMLHAADPIGRTLAGRSGQGLAYGVPRWLVDDAPGAQARGLGGLINRLLDGGGVWGEVYEHLDKKSLLARLDRLHSALLRVTAADAERPPVGSALAAAGGAVLPSAVDPYADPFRYDAALRSARTELVVVNRVVVNRKVHADGIVLGFVIAPAERTAPAEVRYPVLGLGHSRSWQQYDQSFRAGIESGRELAVGLLRSLGVAEAKLSAWQGVRYEVVGLVPPASIVEGSAGLPVALRVLAEVTGLPAHERLGVVATGVADPEHGVFAPVNYVQAKRQAVNVDGLRTHMLYPAASGWQLVLASAPLPQTAAGIGREDIDLSLAAAAELLWGDRWRKWVETQRATAIREAGWAVSSPTAPVEPVPYIVDEVTEDLVDEINEHHPKAFVLGGPANSGKSATAGYIADRVRELDWRVVGLTSEQHALPEQERLVTVVRQAKDAEAAGHERILVVLDGLWPTGRIDLGRVLSAVVDLGVSVLACARFELDGRNWDTGALQVIARFVDSRAVRRLAEQAVETVPRLEQVRPAVGAIANAAGNDLWFLTRLLDWAASQEELTSSVLDHLQDEFFVQRLGPLDKRGRDGVKLLAAVSLVEMDVAEEETGLAQGQLRSLGARSAGHGRWALPSMLAARTLLAPPAEGTGRQSREQQVEREVRSVVQKRLRAAMNSEHDDEVLGWLRGSHRFSARMHSQLVRAYRDELFDWARKTEPVTIARAIRLVDHELGGRVSTLVRTMCRRLQVSEPPNAEELAECLRVVNKYLYFADSEGTQVDLDDLVWALRQEVLVASLTSSDDPAARLEVLRQVERLHRVDSAEQILLFLPTALAVLRPEVADDYITARRALDMEGRVRQELEAEKPVPVAGTTTPRKPATSHKPVEELAQVLALVRRKPTRRDSIAQFVNALVLRLELDHEDGDWGRTLERYNAVLRSSLSRSSLGEQATAFRNLAGYHRALCVRLLNQPELYLSVSRQVETAGPVEVALMLRTVTNLHLRFASSLLQNPRTRGPNAELAREMAKRIRKLADGKGAGMLLSATAAVDDLVGSSRNGFASVLVNELGTTFIDVMFETDHRPSVIYHFIRGVGEAATDHLTELLDRAEDLAERIVVRSARAWGVRLALLIGAQEERGQRFLGALAEKLDEDVVFDRMTNTAQPEGLIAHHELGRVLFPALSGRFLEGDLPGILSRFTYERPQTVALCCVTLAETLDLPEAGPMVLRGLRWDWPKEVRLRCRTAADLTETLRLLTRLDRRTAERTVGELSKSKSPHRKDRGFMVHLVLRSLHTPSSAVELIAAVEAAAPGSGTTLLQEVQENENAWHSFTRELAHEQDPRNQMHVLKHLVRQGLRVDRANGTWIRSLHTKWRDVVGVIRTPLGIADLVTVFAALDPAWGEGIARRVDLNRLSYRMREGATPDLSAAWRVLSAFLVANTHDLAADFAAELSMLDPATVVARCGLSDTVRLAQMLEVVDPALARSYGFAFSRAVDTALSQKYVLDGRRHWSAIGWAARAAARLGAHRPGGVAPTTPAPRATTAAGRLWATAWLDDTPWSQAIRAEATAQLGGEVLRPPADPAGAAMVLTVVGAGALSGTIQPENWSHVHNAPMGLLVALHQDAGDHPDVKPVLDLVRNKMVARAETPSRRSDINAWLLRKILS